MATTKISTTMLAQEQTSISEGTFTPVVAGTSVAGSGASYTTQQGRYVKVGNYVFFTVYVNYSGLSGATGSFRITGLPFTCKNTTNMKWNGFYGYGAGLASPASTVVHAMIAANTAYIDLFSRTVGGNASTALAIDDAAEITISGFYEAA